MGTGMMEGLIFVLCFLQKGNQLLMLKRAKAPNKGKWNCVGGHIEPNESPLAACIREVQEETGFAITAPRFHGLLTWEGFEIPEGGLYLFSTQVPPDREPEENGEGMLAWKDIAWVERSNEVVDNLHVVTPLIMQGASPAMYHFVYKNGVMARSDVFPLPDWVRIDEPFRSVF